MEEDNDVFYDCSMYKDKSSDGNSSQGTIDEERQWSGVFANAVRAHSLCFISVHVRMRKSRGGDQQPSYIAVGSEFFLGEGCPLPRQGAIE
jgi:hypothetical protein